MKISRICPILFACFLSLPGLRAETPTQAVDRVWNAFIALPRDRPNNFPTSFCRLSRQIAREEGIAVLPPIMIRAKGWKDEECLIFVTLVNSLSVDQSIPALEKYKSHGKPWEQQAATDFLIEIEEYQSGLKEMSPAKRAQFLKDTAP